MSEEKNIVKYAKDIKAIKEELSQHVSNKFTFREDQVKIYNGNTFEKTNWASQNMRRIYFSDCTFNNIIFNSTGFTGSIFKNCFFNSGNLDFTIFDECLFIDCSFFGYNLKGTSFCKSEFIRTKFRNVTMHACFMTDCLFNIGEFEDCRIVDIIWENAKFNSWEFNKVQLENLNFEFTYFKDVHFNDTMLPFASIPYIFKGLEYLCTTDDCVFIKSIHPKYERHKMPKEDYFSLIPELIVFYEATTNYFPLANLYFYCGQKEKGVQAIKSGLQFWFNLRNYKLMYYLCELVDVYKLTIEERKEVYKTIENSNQYLQRGCESEFQERWNTYFLRMRDCLLNSQNSPSASIEFLTNIEHNDFQKLVSFIKCFEENFIPENSYYKLEIRHNSPFDIIYNIVSDEQTIFRLVLDAITIFGVCNQVYSNYLNNKINKQNLKKESSKSEKNTIEKDMIKHITMINYNISNINIYNLDGDIHFTAQNIGCEKPDSSGSSQ